MNVDRCCFDFHTTLVPRTSDNPDQRTLEKSTVCSSTAVLQAVPIGVKSGCLLDSGEGCCCTQQSQVGEHAQLASCCENKGWRLQCTYAKMGGLAYSRPYAGLTHLYTAFEVQALIYPSSYSSR